MDQHDAILSDELNHASIIDGCRLSRAKIIRYRHSDMEDLRAKAEEATRSGAYGKVMVITDGVFSMDGDIAKLPEIQHIAEVFDLITYVDDAHGSGVLGDGAGTVKHFGLSDRIDFQIGTLSKAIGVAGGILERSTELQDRLWANGDYLKQGLIKLGYNVGASETPITPCIIGDETLTQAFSKRLMEEGVYAKAIVFPTVPKGTGRIRNMPTAAHTTDMLNEALAAYERVGREMSLI